MHTGGQEIRTSMGILSGRWAWVPAVAWLVMAQSAAAEVTAELRVHRRVYPLGQPVWVDFLLHNTGSEPVTLTVPGVQASHEKPIMMGLPFEHIFSGKDYTALKIATANSKHVGRLVSHTPAGRVTPIQLAPLGTIGTQFDLTERYYLFKQPGTYQITWMPYGGKIQSNTIEITIRAHKQAIIETEIGNITVEFYYEIAPNHVDNFIELAKSGFYNDKTFHRLLPGVLIQGGCPRGDGTGMRPDGKTLKAEFSDIPHELGTLSMARKAGDPNSASCQFFFSLTRIPEFDGQQTVFGHAVGAESLEVLKRLGAIEVKDKDKPVSPIKILHVTIVDAPATMAPSTAPSSKVDGVAAEPPQLTGDR